MKPLRSSTPTLASAAVLAAALFAAAGLQPALAQTAAAPAGAASAPVEAVRPAMAVPLNAGIVALRAQQYPEALAKVAEAEAVGGVTPVERFAIEQLRAAAAVGVGDQATAIKAYRLVLASGRLSAQDQPLITEALLGAAMRGKDWPVAIQTARALADMGVKAPAVRRNLINALYQSGDSAGAAKELLAVVGEDEAAGRRPPEDQLRLLAAAQNKLGDKAAYTGTVERLLRHHPKPAYWRMRIGAVQEQANFPEELVIDSYRLLNAAGAMEDGNEYLAVAELALKVGLPGEARAAMEAGYAAGKLGTGDKAAAHQSLRARAQKEAAEDQKQLATAAAPAANASGMALLGAGMGYVSAGMLEKGIPLMEQGLAKGGVRQPDVARLRLGWAQHLAGRADAAKATMTALKDVAGPAGDLAKLWLIHFDKPKT